MPEKVLLFIDYLGSGGAQRQIINLAKALKERQVNVELAIYYPEFGHFRQDVVNAGIIINEVSKDNTNPVRVLLSLVGLIRKKKFSAVVSFLDTPNLYAELAGVISGCRVIVSERSTFPRPGHLSIKQKAYRWFHLMADYIVTNSNHHRCVLISTFPFLKNKISTVYNIVHREFWQIGGKKRTFDTNNVLCVGTVNRNKNPEALIKALIWMKQERQIQVNVSWAGKRPASGAEAEYGKYCDSLIRTGGIMQQWNWLGEQQNIPALHATHDIMIVCSFYEGLPNCLCEGMATGMIVLASNVCEHPRILDVISDGLLFEPDNYKDLALKLLKVINFPEAEKKRLGGAMHARARELFNETAITAQFMKYIFTHESKR